MGARASQLARARAGSLSSSQKRNTSWAKTRSEVGLGKMWAATVEPSCLPGVKGYEEPGFGAMHTGMCVQRDVTEWHQGVQGWVLVCGYGLKWGWVSPVLRRE